MADEESVKVAVRMRLFNGRENSAGATRIIRMAQEEKGSKTFITNPDTSEERHFLFDYSFQSHSKDEQGIGEYATQDTVFNLLGKPVLYTALDGRNVCLFAYGQTGAGKSFSMLGKAEPKELAGIIPRSCMEIFRLRDLDADDPTVKYNVSIQVVEIYCEMINDLLEDRKKWPPNGHKARLAKDGYVVDTVTRPCFNYDDIESAFTFADKNRSVGSHALNPESSRAHTIYTINYERQKKTSPEAKMAETITAKINLVDLAGSERSESAGTTGQMLKEGNAINLSLTALGSTIKALSEGKRPNFRDSKLTLLLQGSMTNGKVIMIAAVSPASICYDESMSTLRFAERIKMVKIKAKKNVTVDPVAEIKKEMEEMRTRMQEEIDSLKALAGGDVADPAEVEKQLQEALEEKKKAEEDLRKDFELRMKDMSMDDGERKKRAQAISQNWAGALGGASTEKKEDIKEPHLRNLNEDSRLAETLSYKFKDGETKIGRSDKEAPPDIEFNGMGILKGHCTVVWNSSEKKVTVIPAKGSATVVNGKRITEPTPLVNNNRLWLGNNYAFRFVYPGEEKAGEQFESSPDYLFAESEMAENTNHPKVGGQSALNHQLSEVLKKVEQANIIATDLNQDCSFQPKIVKNQQTGEDTVIVNVSLPGAELLWPLGKFSERLVHMVRCWQDWQQAQDKGQNWLEPDPSESPFVDNEDQLIGECNVYTALDNMMPQELTPKILAVTAKTLGTLEVEINPLDKEGGEGPWEDGDELDPFVDSENIEELEALKGTDIGYVVKVKNVTLTDESVAAGGQCIYKDMWVRYRLINEIGEAWEKTEKVKGSDLKMNFGFKRKHTRHVDDHFYQCLTKKDSSRAMIVQLWGALREQSGGAAGRKTAVVDDIKGKQRELLDLLVGAGVKEKAVKDASAVTLPENWSVTLAYKGPDGRLYEKPPVDDGGADEEIAG